MHSRFSLVTLALLTLVSFATQPLSEAEVQVLLDRAKSIRQSTDRKELQQLIDDIHKTWPDAKDDDYYRVILELCGALHSSAGKDLSRGLTARSLTIEAFDAPGDKAALFRVRLMLSLRNDPDYSNGSLRGAAWNKERPVRVARWLHTWAELKTALSKLPEKVELPQFEVQPPDGAGIMAGMSSKLIKDPNLRKKYEDAIEANTETNRIYRLKEDLIRYERLFVMPAKQYITEAYSKAPYNTAELEQLLARSVINAETQSAIIAEVKQRVAAPAGCHCNTAPGDHNAAPKPPWSNHLEN